MARIQKAGPEKISMKHAHRLHAVSAYVMPEQRKEPAPGGMLADLLSDDDIWR